ncbi:acid protease [Mycena crocata]|nr:acid protease [Mycena crocata]
MQLPAPLLALLATTILGLSSVDARPLKPRMITLPMRRIETTNHHIPVELRHEQHLNRGKRLLARAAGHPEPSDSELRANLERRASYLSPANKRFNVPSSDFISSTDEPDLTVSNLATGNAVALDNAPVLAKHSSQIDTDGFDTSYVVTVQIGTPPRDFAIILDSGSGDFWVQGDPCTSSETGDGCGNHTFVSSDSSSTFVNTKKQWDITYGSGSAAGELISDTLVLAGMVLNNHTFGMANTISESFVGDNVADGLMGLGKAGLSNQKTPTPVQALVNAGFISQAITSYRLPRLVDDTNNGEITFGALDESKFDPSTRVTIKSPGNDFWIANLGGVSVEGDDVEIIGKTALMDTGTTLLIVDEKDAAAIHAKIPGAKLGDSGRYTLPCDSTASVALKFAGISFAIDAKDLKFASNGRTTGDCTSGISPTSGGNVTQWLVGDTFMKAVYFSTNADENTITLAKAT